MRSSSSILQLLSSATMSRVSYRGRNSWRRGFSDRPTGGRDGFVSGDSHFRSVGDANYTFRQVDGGGGFHQQQPPPFHQPPPPHFHGAPPPFRQGPPFNQPPPFHQTPRFHQPPNFHQPRTFRPPNNKPPDYRNWEYALSQPPSQCERFIVLSYNILADYLAINHRRELYYHIPPYVLDWEWRKRKILFELGLWSPDIMCLQEVDRFQDLEEELKLYGYSGIWKMRTGIPVDGCAIFWRTTRFKLLHEESIEYNKLELRDNVAQICVLESRNQNCADGRSDALPQSSNGVNQVVVCNTHVLYNPRRGEIKLGQVRVLLDRAHAVSKLWNDAPVVICGDFNCTPKSPLYNFISEQKLDLKELARDQVSGQSSAQIHKQMPYTPNPGHVFSRVQNPDNSNEASTVGEEKVVGAKQCDCIPDIHNHMNRNGESSHFTNNLLQNATHVSCREENNSILDESTKEVQQEERDSFKNIRSICHVPVELLPVDSGNDGFQNRTLPLTSCENCDSVVVENGHEDHSHRETLSQHSHSNSNRSGLLTSTIENRSVNYEMDKQTTDMKKDITSFVNTIPSSQSRNDGKLENAFVQDIKSDLILDTSFAEDNIVSISESLGKFSLNPIAGEGKEDVTSDLAPDTSFPNDSVSLGSDPVQSITGEETPDPSTSDRGIHEIDISDVSTCVDFHEDQNHFSMNNLGEVAEEDGSFVQARSSTLPSEPYRTADSFPSDADHGSKSVRPKSGETDQYLEKFASSPQQLHLAPLCNEIQNDSSFASDYILATSMNNTYDPSSWTPMEIEKASGHAECTLIEHPLKLRSTYTEIEDCSGTRDASREPLVTSYNRRFMGTVDYIWCSEGLQTVKVLDTIPKRALQWTPGFPTKKWGSDHIALASQLAFTKCRDQS